MKRIFAPLIVLVAFTTWLCIAAPPTVQLQWDASPDKLPTNLTYVLYAHTNSISATNIGGTVMRSVAGTNLSASIEIPNKGRWYFVVTCFLGTEDHRYGPESLQSNEVIWEIVDPPVNLRTVVLQHSATLTNFQDVGYLRLRLPDR